MKCKVCHKELKIRRRFSDKTKGKFPVYHLHNGQPCHGFWLEMYE